jgi:hypothetical protein
MVGEHSDDTLHLHLDQGRVCRARGLDSSAVLTGRSIRLTTGGADRRDSDALLSRSAQGKPHHA